MHKMFASRNTYIMFHIAYIKLIDTVDKSRNTNS